MGKALIIAEKPSVAGDIAKALGRFERKDEGSCYENDKYVVSSAVGHLLELTVPGGIRRRSGASGRSTSCPTSRRVSRCKPIEKSQARLKTLAKADQAQGCRLPWSTPATPAAKGN
jgi:DNA topoisomerase-3